MLRIGIDIGGTFTDFAIWDGGPAGYTAVRPMKVPSTPPDFAGAVKREHRDPVAQQRHQTRQPMLIVHGTTVATNAIIERSGPKVALLVTAGFPDILNVARLRVERPVDPIPSPPTRLDAAASGL